MAGELWDASTNAQSVAAVASAIAAMFSVITAIIALRIAYTANKIGAQGSRSAQASNYLEAMARWRQKTDETELSKSFQRHAIAQLIMLVDMCYEHGEHKSAAVWAASLQAFPLLRSGSYGGKELAQRPETREAIRSVIDGAGNEASSNLQRHTSG